MRFPFTAYLETDDGEIELSVIYEVSKSYPATHLQPAEGGEVEVISVRQNGQERVLTTAQEEWLLEQCRDRMADDIADEAAAEADWRYQEYRDRQLMDGLTLTERSEP